MKVNPNLKFLRDEHLKTRVLVLQGSTRSGKTYATLQFLIETCFKYEGAGMVITIARATLPALKGSVLRDFIELLTSFNHYSEEDHNKTENTYNLYGSLIEFISLDQPQKVRGRKRDILFVNEANEISLEGFNQLLFRCTGFAIIDYNPSEPEHWIYDDVLTRKDCQLLITTYKDNPHLTDIVIAEIERFKDKDPDYFAVYGEGRRASARKGQIFKDWERISLIPWEDCSMIVYGVDFGFSSDPTSVVKMGIKNDTRFIEQVVYEKGLTSGLLADRLRGAEVNRNAYLICDSSEPRSIIELREHAFNAVGVKKGKDSIRNGINKLKALTIFVHENSKDIWNEVSWYAWAMDKSEKPTDQPIDSKNHAMDAIRYANTIKSRI